MRFESSITTFAFLILLNFSVVEVRGKSIGQHEFRSTIGSLPYDLDTVLHFVDYLSKDIGKTESKGDKSRSVVPNDQGALNHLLNDESVIENKAKKAAKSVAKSVKAMLKTQKGVKKIAEGLEKFKKCIKTFEKTIKL